MDDWLFNRNVGNVLFCTIGTLENAIIPGKLSENSGLDTQLLISMVPGTLEEVVQ